MRLVLGINGRYQRTPDGRVWAEHADWNYAALRRYLDAFDEILVVARVKPVVRVPEGLSAASGKGIHFADTPYFIGPWQYLRKVAQLKKALRGLVRRNDAVILRLPAWHVTYALAQALPKSHRYAVEVCGHANSAPTTSVRNPLLAFIRRSVSRRTRHLCADASVVAYVTDAYLQVAYPSAADARVHDGCSNVRLPADAFAATPRTTFHTDPLRLIYVGSLQSRLKGVQHLVEAVGIATSCGANLELTVIGDGGQRSALEGSVSDLRLDARVRFTGYLHSRTELQGHLDQSDLFILPSLTEGLPRALVEAMARGLPCIASEVGGIPELLGEQAMFEPGNARELADQILRLYRQPERLPGMAQDNLARAREFHLDAMTRRHRAFWGDVVARQEPVGGFE